MRSWIAVFVLVNALLSASVIDDWERSSYHAYRLIVEISPEPRMRYEEVYRWGDSKLVNVLLPRKITWYRNSKKMWLGSGVLREVPTPFFDLEDLALRELKESTNVSIEKHWYGYLIKFDTDEGHFEIILSERGIPLKIVRRLHGIVYKMIYEDILGIPPSMENVVRELKISKESFFPEEIGKVISCFDWFDVDFENGVMVINGLMNGEWVKVEISLKKIDGSRKIGRFYLRAPERFFDVLKGK